MKSLNFNSKTVKKFRKLLLPLAWIYGLVIFLRNKLYDAKILRSRSFPVPIICVGNISAGGTGKTPMVIHLGKLLSLQKDLAILSRGYGRKTKGFLLANFIPDPERIGDEPALIKQSLPQLPIAVCEDRKIGISKLQQFLPKLDVVIMDDGFQHRSLQTNFNIILSAYNDLFTKDYFLPFGNLRDSKSALKRADILVVTKCPIDIEQAEMNKIREKSAKYISNIFFSAIKYKEIYNAQTKDVYLLNNNVSVLLFSGIANPENMEQYIRLQSQSVIMRIFPDHYDFKRNDLEALDEEFRKIKNLNKIILTTEKDAVKIEKLKNKENLIFDYYVLPISIEILEDKMTVFDQMINRFLQKEG